MRACSPIRGEDSAGDFARQRREYRVQAPVPRRARRAEAGRVHHRVVGSRAVRRAEQQSVQDRGAGARPVAFARRRERLLRHRQQGRRVLPPHGREPAREHRAHRRQAGYRLAGRDHQGDARRLCRGHHRPPVLHLQRVRQLHDPASGGRAAPPPPARPRKTRSSTTGTTSTSPTRETCWTGS